MRGIRNPTYQQHVLHIELVKTWLLGWPDEKGAVRSGEAVLSNSNSASGIPVVFYLQIPGQIRSETRTELKHSKRKHSRHRPTIKISSRLVSHLVHHESVEKSHYLKIKLKSSSPKKQALQSEKLYSATISSTC
jgi:hypothetical protein